VHVNAGQLTHYPGGYDYYLDKTKAASERAGLTAGVNRSLSKSDNVPANRMSNARKDQKRAEAEERQARSRERKTQQQVVHKLEKEIQELEARQAELTTELENPETYARGGRAVEINRELMHIQERLAELNPQWETEASKLAAID
jgi:ATP-binding cassette subfamily F protein 3